MLTCYTHWLIGETTIVNVIYSVDHLVVCFVRIGSCSTSVFC